MKTFTEMEIEEIKKLCNRAFELCARKGVVHKLGTNATGRHTIDGVVVDIPIEQLESIRNSNAALVDSELLGVLNRLVDFTDYIDCKGEKNMSWKTDVDSNETTRDVFFSQLKMRIYKAISMLRLPLYVVKDSNEARERVWIEVSKGVVYFSRAEFDIALESVIEEALAVGKIEEDIASGNKDTATVCALKQEIKERLKKMNHTPLKLLTDADLLREFWLILRSRHGASKELFENVLIDVLHEEYGYNLKSLKSMNSMREDGQK